MPSTYKPYLSWAVRLFAQTAGTRILGMAASSLLVVLLSRTLDPDQYGVYALFTTTYIFGNLLFGLNLSGNLSRRVPGKSPAEAASLLTTFLLAEIVVGALVLGLVLVVGLDGWAARLLDIAQYRREFRVILLVVWVDLGAGSCLNYLLARKQFGLANVMTLLRASSLGPGLALVWLFRGRITIASISNVWLSCALLSLLFGILATKLPLFVRRGVDWAALRGSVTFGLMLASQSFSFYFLKLADRYVLARYANLHDIGIYSFAYTLSNIAYSLSALVLVGLFQPHVVEAHNRGDLARRDVLLAQLTRVCLASVLLAAAVTALLSRHVIFFARPSYQDSAGVLPWLLLTLLPIVAAYPAAILLMLEGKLWASLAGGIAAIAVALPLNLVLVPRFSYYGALGASLAGLCILACVQHAVARSWRFLTPSHLRGLVGDLRALRGGGAPTENPAA